MRRAVEGLIVLFIVVVMCYSIPMLLPDRTEEYGPFPPTRIEKLEAENVAIRARLTELERNAGACPW